MSVSYWLDKSASTKEYDVVIIGGGIAGHSLAYWFQKLMPDFKVALLEKGELGSGATGRNAGFVTCGSVEHFNRLVETHGKDLALEMWQFSEENLKLLKEEIIDDPSALFFEEKGSFSLASSDNEFKELKKSATLMESLGIEVEVLEEAAIQKRLKAHGFVGGIKYLRDASIHPIKLLDKIHQLTSQKGVDFHTLTEVFALERKGDKRLIKTNKGSFQCDAVVLATNGYSSLLHPFFQGKIEPTRGQILAVEPVEKFMEGPCYANFVLDYFRQLPTGELLIGGFRQLQKEKEQGFSDETNPLIQKALEDFIKEHLPLLKDKKITHRWSGIMGFSQDGQPFIGSLPDDPQTYFLGGFTAHGLGLAFHGAKTLVRAMLGESIPHWLSARRI